MDRNAAYSGWQRRASSSCDLVDRNRPRSKPHSEASATAKELSSRAPPPKGPPRLLNSARISATSQGNKFPRPTLPPVVQRAPNQRLDDRTPAGNQIHQLHSIPQCCPRRRVVEDAPRRSRTAKHLRRNCFKTPSLIRRVIPPRRPMQAKVNQFAPSARIRGRLHHRRVRSCARHLELTQHRISLTPEPTRVSRLEHNCAFVQSPKHLEERGRPFGIQRQLRRHLQQDRPTLLAQSTRLFQEAFYRRARLRLQLPFMRHFPRHLYRKPEIVRHRSRPLPVRLHLVFAMKARVDLRAVHPARIPHKMRALARELLRVCAGYVPPRRSNVNVSHHRKITLSIT
jgi:hypothetical protein